MTLAYNAHRGQTDKSGVPYILHPARVAADFSDEAEACAAWLHDVVEDTAYTIDDIRLAGFGEAICNAVKTLTHDKQIPYADYVKRIAKDPIARAVKLADLQDNMDTSRLPVLDEEAERRLAKYRAAYAYLTGDMNAFDADDYLCPEGYCYYYVEHLDLVGRTQGDNALTSEVYQRGKGWARDIDHEISDRILGYVPDEEPGWRIGNSDLMEEICPVSCERAAQLIRRAGK